MKKDCSLNNFKRPIGIFDSGFGGLTVMKEIIKALPYEDIVYFGDTARLPYGSKSKETIERFSIEIASFLCTHHVKIMVVACNTASSFALKQLRQYLDIPVIGVVEPGVIAAHNSTKSGKIGVIGTTGTISSKAYQQALKRHNRHCTISTQPCPLFVPLVEEGWNNSDIAVHIAEIYGKPLKQKKIDTLILGCTHYPLLKKTIASVMGQDITIVDSARETAKMVKLTLEQIKPIITSVPENPIESHIFRQTSKFPNTNTLNQKIIISKKQKPSYRFFVSDSPKKFQKLGKKFLGKTISSVKKIRLEDLFVNY